MSLSNLAFTPVLLLAGVLGTACAQTYPVKPIKLVVPYAPGGVSDSLARALAQRLAPALAQPVLVENKAGGNTVIGADAVAKAAPDGYTLLLTAEATLAMNPALYAKLPYSVERDFVPIVTLVQIPQSFVVAPSHPAGNLRDFIADATQPGRKLSYATLGVGSTAHLNMELFQKSAKTSMSDVSYKGAAPALTDLMGGHVTAMIVSTGLIAPQVAAGKLKALAVGGNKRSPLIPSAPTFAEAGMPGFQPSSWFALLAPASTSPEVVKRLNIEINKILADPVFKADSLAKFGAEAAGGTPEQLAALIKAETQTWSAIIRDTKVRLE